MLNILLKIFLFYSQRINPTAELPFERSIAIHNSSGVFSHHSIPNIGNATIPCKCPIISANIYSYINSFLEATDINKAYTYDPTTTCYVWGQWKQWFAVYFDSLPR